MSANGSNGHAPATSAPAATLFTRYRVTIQIRDRLMGGVPKRADVIEAWLRRNTGVEEQEELRMMTRRTLVELGQDIPEDATFEQMVEASKSLAAERSTVGFKVDNVNGVYIETRQIKAMIKESVAVLFSGEKWGVTRKGPRNFVAERVFVEGDRVYLGIPEPDGIDMVIGHVTGPQGPRSTLTYHEYARAPQISFVAMSLNDCITPDQWVSILGHAGENGLGALRSQGHGRFDVVSMIRLREKGGASFAIADEPAEDTVPLVVGKKPALRGR